MKHLLPEFKQGQYRARFKTTYIFELCTPPRLQRDDRRHGLVLDAHEPSHYGMRLVPRPFKKLLAHTHTHTCACTHTNSCTHTGYPEASDACKIACSSSECDEAGPNRIGPLVRENHFGTIEVDWTSRNVALAFRLAEGPDAGSIIANRTLSFSI